MTLPPYPCLGVKIDGDCPQTPSYPARECTSGGAWWGSRITGKPWPQGWGNADNWPAAARAAGFRVDLTPEINSIMCIPTFTHGSGPKGHIAVVVGNPAANVAPVWEMNFLIEYGFDFRTAPTSGCEYIHLEAPIPVPQPPTKEQPMFVIQGPGNAGLYFLYPTGRMIPLGAGSDVSSANAAGVKTIVIADQEAWNAMTAESTRVGSIKGVA